MIDRLLGTCIAITDQAEQTVLLCSADLLHTNKEMVAIARERITAATGVPAEHIMIAATHTHSGPGINSSSLDATQEYYQYFARQLTKAAVEALADRKPAQISVGQKNASGMTFVRHYRMNDGTYAGACFGSWESGIKDHACPADEQMQIIRFQRRGGRDIVLLNWQSHATIIGRISTDTDMSADYIGTLRNHLEGAAGCHFAFFQGACGNLVPSSKIKEEMLIEHDHVIYGRKLAQIVLEELDTLHAVQSGPIRNRQLIYSAMVDHSDDHLLPAARKVREEFYKIKDPAAAKQLVKENGFNSVYHANGVISRAALEEALSIELNALSVGDISFITAPYEMFCSNGVYIKENTPFKLTFIMGYCNGSYSYIADEAAFGYDCYEVNTRRFCKGTAEDIVKTHVQLLIELKNG